MSSVQPVDAAELRRTLEVLLATPGTGHRATRPQIANFEQYLQQCPVEWRALRDGPASAPRALFFALLLPGRTAIVMIPTPDELGIEDAAQRALTAEGVATLQARQLHYAQALLEPEAVAKRFPLEAAGFTFLAPLLYLERDALYPWMEPPQPAAAEWLPYSARSHAEFAHVLLRTYENSGDCPELVGLRPVEDILAAHKASGRFEPGLWQIARVAGESAGCLLLTELTAGALLEIVYMGVLPEFRRRGVGTLLMRRALEQCRRAGAKRLTVVVDERNEAARRLYARFALISIARRDVYLCCRWGARPVS